MNQHVYLNESSLGGLREACDAYGVRMEEVYRIVSSLVSACTYSLEEATRSWGATINSLLEETKPLFEELRPLTELVLEEGWGFVPPKVRHLALHHPKARARNKNWNRMWAAQERYRKCQR